MMMESSEQRTHLTKVAFLASVQTASACAVSLKAAQNWEFSAATTRPNRPREVVLGVLESSV
jgi:hypothetical protein